MYLNIGAVPNDEECAQVGSEGYAGRASRECRAYINQLRRVFGLEPDGVRLKKMSFPHDYGTYHEVAVEYDETITGEEMTYVKKIENGCDEWDETAKMELLIGNNAGKKFIAEDVDPFEEDRLVSCPSCHTERMVEPDAECTYICEGCHATVKVLSLC